VGAARIGRESVEVLIATVGEARIGRESLEILIATPGAARIGRQSVEVLMVNTEPTVVPFIGWGVPLDC
jgi:hypothetical protein